MQASASFEINSCVDDPEAGTRQVQIHDDNGCVADSGSHQLLSTLDAGDQSHNAAMTNERLPCCCRCVVNLINCVIFAWAGVFFILVILCLCVVCCPCLVCMLYDRIRSGRTVQLDGTQPPRINNDTREVIVQAQSPYHARLESFVTRSFSNLQPSLRRSVSRQSTASVPLSFSSAAPASGVEQIRDELKQARRDHCERNSQKLPGYLRVNVEREHVLHQSLLCIGSVSYVDLLAKYLRVSFENEHGIDAGGVARDWFDSIGLSLVVAAERGEGPMMVLPDKTVSPRPFDDRFTDLFAIGRLIGLAVWFGIPLPVPLCSVSCKFLLDTHVSPSDLRRLDPEFFQFRVKPLLRRGGVEELEEALGEPLMFVSAATDLRASKELCPNGAEKRVTEDNKKEYLKLLCEYYLCGETREQINVLLKGFWEIFPKDDLICTGINHRQLALLVSGYSTLDVNDWREHTALNSWNGHSQVVDWFWAVVEEMSDEDRGKLLHFATGSSRLPSTGFRGIDPQFNISLSAEEVDHLPHAHTCGNQLVLPRYTSKQSLEQKLRVALANDAGFGFA